MAARDKCDAPRDFAHALLRMRDLPIAFQDERLSTKAVESAMLAADMTRRRAERRDALAAAWILQSALDELDAAGTATGCDFRWTAVMPRH